MDRDAIRKLPFSRRSYESPGYILREGEPARKHCSFVISGLAFRQKLTAEGARQIVSIHIAGDFLDLQHLFLNYADHSVQALTRLECAEIARDALQDLVLQHPVVGRALWTDALVDASIFREWIANIGRRNARARIAHLLCEFAVRLQAAKLGTPEGFMSPMSQEWISDAVSLTSVHVNRVLMALQAEGLIHRSRRWIEVRDWDGLVEAGDFNPAYLHLDQVHPAAV